MERPAPSKLTAAFSLRANLRALFVPRPGAVPAVTGLRALSMMWVLVAHVHQGLRPLGLTLPGAMFLAHPVLKLGWAGNLGIEMFFVISGYLIGGILMAERETTGAIGMGSYYARRALRILPVYVLAMVVYLALSAEKSDTAWANLLFVNDFIPFQQQFMAHCWSLAIEEQFFAVAPLLVLLLYRTRPSWRVPLIWLSVIAACGIAVAVVLTQRLELSLRFPSGLQFWRYMDAFYTKPWTRFGSIAMGILVAMLERGGQMRAVVERRGVVATVLALLAIGAIVAVIIVFPEGRSPTGERLLVGSLQLALSGYVFGASIAYLLFLSRSSHPLGRLLTRVLGSRVLHPFAQLSYAMYLFHPICIKPIFGWIGFDLAHPWLSYARVVACAFAVSTVAAMVVFLVVELPIMRLRPPPKAPTG